jgi:hypothetical protein
MWVSNMTAKTQNRARVRNQVVTARPDTSGQGATAVSAAVRVPTA